MKQQKNTIQKPLKKTNMTPKEKAKELLDKFIPHTRVFHDVLGWEDYIDSAKQCALIAVDEIMTALTVIHYGMQYLSAIDYWEGVKQEIEKL